MTRFALAAALALLGPGCLVPGIKVGTQVTGGASTGGQTSGGQTGGSTTGPCLVLNEPSLDFGYVPVGTTATKQVTLTNQCSALMKIVDSVDGSDASLFSVSNAPATLAPFDSGTVSVSYAPLAYTAQSIATVEFAEFARGTAIELMLKLLGHPTGSPLRLSPSIINFGFVELGTTAIGCTTATNYSSSAIDVTGLMGFATEGGVFAVSQVDDETPSNPAPFPVSIPGGIRAGLCFSFTPPIIQQYSGKATLTTDNPAVVAPTVQLTGWGGGPRISCIPTRIDYGRTLGHPVTIPIICTNTGSPIPDGGLTVQLEIVGPGASAWSADLDTEEPPDGYQPGQSFQIDLTFMPGDGGDYGATLVIESNAGDFKIPLTGQSLNVPPCQFVISSPTLDFANVPVGGTSAPLGFEIQNVGTDTCTVKGLAIDGDDAGAFHLVAISLNPDSAGRYAIPAPATGVDSSLAIAVDFAPALPGQSYSAELAFSISDPSDPKQVVPLSGTSESTCLKVTPLSLNFGDAGVDDAGGFLPTVQQFLSVSNVCDGAARLASIALQSGPGDSLPQYSAVNGPSLPAVIAAGSSLSYGLSCAPTTPGAHPAELVLSDGNVETLVALSCNAP